MKRPLALYAAPVLLLGKGLSLLYMAFGSSSGYHPKEFLQAFVYLGVAAWLYFQPKWARWLVGVFFAYAALKEATVLPTLQGSTLDLIRRPVSLAMAAWFAWSLLLGSDTRRFVTKKEPNQPLQPTRFARG